MSVGLKATILGCGSSGGVPRPALGWGDCDPTEPKNRRRRCSILVERDSPAGTTRLLVDTSPDLREQLLDAGVTHLDAVLFSHDHADHTHGIDDLRQVAFNGRRRVDVYYDEATGRTLNARFGLMRAIQSSACSTERWLGCGAGLRASMIHTSRS